MVQRHMRSVVQRVPDGVHMPMSMRLCKLEVLALLMQES